MNQVFFAIISLAFGFAILNGTPEEVGLAALEQAKGAVTLALGLVGYIALFLGLMKVVEEAGGLKFMARMIRPIMVRLFPEIPPDHPAMGAMIMNVAANALGLGNAATPFGLKAMDELNTLNKEKGTATNAMVLFLAINTSGLALLPTGIIGLRQEFGSVDPAIIFPTTLIATACSTVVGIMVAKGLSQVRVFAAPPAQIEADREQANLPSARTQLVDLLYLACFASALVGLVLAVYFYKAKASVWIMPGLIFGMLLIGVVRKVPVYEVFVKGAKEGFGLAIMIIPYLVAILCAVGMLRSSGGLEVIVTWIGQGTQHIGLPAEVLPLALLRPLSGSGAYGLTADILGTYGPDSLVGQLASTMNGSTETTFYVLAVYFGAVGVNKTRHAVPAGLAADLTGVLASVFAVRTLLTPSADAAPVAENETVDETPVIVEMESLCTNPMDDSGWHRLLEEPHRALIQTGDNPVRLTIEVAAHAPLRIQACKALEGGQMKIMLLDDQYQQRANSHRPQGEEDSDPELVLLEYEPEEAGTYHIWFDVPEMPNGVWAIETELIVLQQDVAEAQ